MIKLLATFIAVASFALYSLFVTSSRDTHSFFYINGDNIYENSRKDGSFGDSVAIFCVEKIQNLKNRISTGEYEIKKSDTVFDFLTKLFLRKTVKRKITIPEGLTVKQIVEKINDNPYLFGKIEDIPKEASLMPNTYFYEFGDTKSSIIDKMKNQMKKIYDKYSKENKTKFSMDDIIILASIIEKESANKNEAFKISSVFHNRLRIKMRLQSDPTIIYAMSDGYGKIDRPLNRKDLFYQSPYNTYRNGGLPPTAICCPGENSIKAALNPEPTDYIYFVLNADSSGHMFSKEYSKHLKNIKIRKNKNA